MVRGSNAVAAVAVVILLYVAVIRSHLGAGQGGSVDDSVGADTALAVLQLQRELNGVRGELAAIHTGIDKLDRKLTGLVMQQAGQPAAPDHRPAVAVPPAHPGDSHGAASLGQRSDAVSAASAAPATNFSGCGFRPKQHIRRYMIDSWGGSRSQFLQEYLQKTTMKHGAKAMVDHIHDRFPPKFMAYPRAEKFTKRAMTDVDRGATLLILLTRRPAKSLSSRMYMAHCLNMQGDAATCRAMSGLTRLEILNNYVAAGKDTLHIRDHWDAYKALPAAVEVYHLDSDDLFVPERFAVIRMHLGLPDDAEPPRFLSKGDHDHFEKPQNVLDGLDRIYANLTAEMKTERDTFWASC